MRRQKSIRSRLEEVKQTYPKEPYAHGLIDALRWVLGEVDV